MAELLFREVPVLKTILGNSLTQLSQEQISFTISVRLSYIDTSSSSFPKSDKNLFIKQ